MFNHKHYVPILKTKAGERWAVNHLNSIIRDGMTPLFEIHAHNTQSHDDHITEMCKQIATVWGQSKPCYVDAVHIHGESGSPAILDRVFNEARNAGIQAIPVVRIAYGMHSLDSIRNALATDNRGYLLRLAHTEVGAHPAINGVVSYVGASASDVDLMIDYRGRAMDLSADVPLIFNVASWRTLSAASGIFPRSLANLSLRAWHQIQRYCWISWESDVLTGKLPRKPSFSDYALRAPGPPAKGGDPPVSLKYTKEDYWLVRHDGKLQQGDAPEMYTICQSLIARPEFDGQAYSEGDRMIHDTANHAMTNAGTGGPQQWLQWGLNHHMTFVVNQIQSHASL